MSRFVSAAAAAMLVAGCGGAQLGRRNRVLSHKVSSLRARAREDRDHIRDLDNQIALLKEKLASATVAASDSVPPLPVEVVQPPPPAETSAQPAAADPPGHGSAAADTSGSGRVVYLTNVGDRGHRDALPPAGHARPVPPRRHRRARPASTPTAGAPLPAWHGPVPAVASELDPRVHRRAASRAESGASAADLRAEYHRYYEALKAGYRAYAITGFRKFIRRHPRSNYADNAQYWLGEAYYAQKKYRTALAEFHKVIQNYPHGNKVPDAMLKIAYCDQNLGDDVHTRALLRKLVERYPGSNPAALAVKRLEVLSRPGGGTH